jgi:hypothetical protein
VRLWYVAEEARVQSTGFSFKNEEGLMSVLPEWLAPVTMGLGVAALAMGAANAWIRTKVQRRKFEEQTREMSREMFEALLLPHMVGRERLPEAKPELPPEVHPGLKHDPGLPKKPPKIIKHEATPVAAAQQHQFMPIAVTLLILLSALWVILSNNAYDEGTKRWAFGAVGLVAGYWLNTKRH